MENIGLLMKKAVMIHRGFKDIYILNDFLKSWNEDVKNTVCENK